MKKFIKVMVIILVITGILFIAALASVPLWFPVNKVKTIMTEQLKEKTGREIEIKELKFNIFTGFELHNVSVSENKRYKTDKPFLKTDMIILKYNLFALLKKTLFIHDFRIISPYGHIIKEADGTFNFSDILVNAAKGGGTKTLKTEKKPDKKEKTAKSPGMDLIVSAVSIKDGNFTYLDRSKVPFMTVGIRGLNFKLDDLVLSVVKPVGLSLDCTAFYNNYNIPVFLKSEIKADLENKKAELKINPFTIGGIKSTGTVRLINFKDVRGKITSVSNTKKMLEVLPPDLQKKIKDVNADINIQNNLDFSVTSGKLKFSDNLTMSDGEFEYMGKKVVEGLKAKFDVSDSYNLSGNIDFLLAGSKVNIKAKGEDINRPFESVVTVDVSSPKFAVEYLLAMFPKKEKKKTKDMTAEEKAVFKKQKEAAAKKTKESLRKMKGKNMPGFYLNLDADSITYKDVNTGRAISRVRYVDNKLYAETSVNAYKGNLNNNLVVDIEKESYSVDLTIKNVEINKLIEDAITIIPKEKSKKDKKTILDDMKDKVYGSLYLDSRFSGATFDDIGRTIKGKGGFDVKYGKLTALQMGRDLAKNLGVEMLGREIPFDTLNGAFEMAKGRIDVTKFRLAHKEGDMKISAAGYVTIDKAVDMKVQMDIGPKDAEKFEQYVAKTFSIKDFSYAYDKNGWLPFDFRIYNRLDGKKYDYNQPRMFENIKRNIAKKAENEAKKAIEKKGSELLKNLLGR